MEVLYGRNYINSMWGPMRADFVVGEPAAGTVLGYAPQATKEEIDSAVAAANDALAIWGDPRRYSWVRRAEIIDEWVQLLKADKEGLAKLITRESGKHIDEARADVVEAIHMLQYCAGRGRHPIGHKISSEIPDKESETYLSPRGVCTVITPWNFPVAIPTWLIGPALVSGNTVVFKPSEDTPLCGQRLVELFHEATRGPIRDTSLVPPGVLNLVHGDGEVGSYLVSHPGTVGQLFTGSYAVGAEVKKKTAEHFDKFAVCEMGGKNSVIVLKDADLELAVAASILSAFKTAHQRCVSADMLIVEEAIEPEFTQLFLDKVKRLRFGDPFDPKNFAGPLINNAAVEKYFDCERTILADGAERLTSYVGGRHGLYVLPNVFRMQYRPTTFALREEFFTPNVVIVPVRDFDEALHVANDHEYGLSMALITNDFRKMREFKIRGRAGLKYVNLPSIGAEVHLPFGGMRRSGTGMPSAAWLFNYLCHETAFTVNYGQEIKLAQGLSARV
ncbi:MAG: aldehyde dehydrogenase family protein [Candidatus Sungiibacteriota bacterium]|uniref:Aldehyde dehydrogenase family protein n=1 Tax=Candidatus Sungiibacteriota bacterium TaxID=2750080 RepID=A0A7T5USJ1_9BACT|nr:MAG: aldehyde dehydrogenase family protein [Candidatus Sungbacteria bacterium]